MRDAFVNTLVDIASRDEKVYLITGDLGFGVLKPFWEKLPKQFINAGIAEQSMMGIAAGLAKEGNIVFVYSIGNFPTLRCLEQIRNDCAYHDVNVKIICVGGGFTYGALGMSHHATEDIAIMRALPEVFVSAPSDAGQTINIVHELYKRQGTCYLRLGRGGEMPLGLEKQYSVDRAVDIYSGEDIAIFFTGDIYSEILQARNILFDEGVNVAVVSFPVVKPIDINLIEEYAQHFKLIVTVEEHNIIGGFGSAVCEIIAEMKIVKARVLRIGLRDQYSSIVGSQQYLRNYYGLSAKEIVNQINKRIKEFL